MLAYKESSPATYEALLALERRVRAQRLEPALVELVYLRVSQLNGCAFCIAMHDTALRKLGVAPAKLALLPVFREAPGYSPPERAALAFAEATTRLAGHDPAALDDVRRELGDPAVVELMLAIAMINTWNRFNVAFATPVPA